jgi:hypothetical protein
LAQLLIAGCYVLAQLPFFGTQSGQVDDGLAGLV